MITLAIPANFENGNSCFIVSPPISEMNTFRSYLTEFM